MSRHDEPIELLYQPKPSGMPILLAVGLVLVMIGLWSAPAFSVFGAVFVLVALVKMIATTRDSISRMPREQQPFTSGHRFR